MNVYVIIKSKNNLLKINDNDYYNFLFNELRYKLYVVDIIGVFLEKFNIDWFFYLLLYNVY